MQQYIKKLGQPSPHDRIVVSRQPCIAVIAWCKLRSSGDEVGQPLGFWEYPTAEKTLEALDGFTPEPQERLVEAVFCHQAIAYSDGYGGAQIGASDRQYPEFPIIRSLYR
jgi:hypothetical protein